MERDRRGTWADVVLFIRVGLRHLLTATGGAISYHSIMADKTGDAWYGIALVAFAILSGVVELFNEVRKRTTHTLPPKDDGD